MQAIDLANDAIWPAIAVGDLAANLCAIQQTACPQLAMMSFQTARGIQEIVMPNQTGNKCLGRQ